MRFLVERQEQSGAWNSVGDVEADGDEAAARAVEDVARVTGIYRIWPADSATEDAELYEVQSDGRAVMIDG